METKALLIAAALLAGLAGRATPALAQTAPDPLACVKTVDGAPIRIGDTVLDAAGQEIGAVSLAQCSADRRSTKLYVRLKPAFGGNVKAVDLSQVRTRGRQVILALSSEAMARIPAVTGRNSG